jgi:transposase-like protein
MSISKERNIFVAERFLSSIVEEYGVYPVSTDGGTWYPQACQFLKLSHHIHFLYTRIFQNFLFFVNILRFIFLYPVPFLRKKT